MFSTPLELRAVKYVPLACPFKDLYFFDIIILDNIRMPFEVLIDVEILKLNERSGPWLGFQSCGCRFSEMLLKTDNKVTFE